MSKKKKNKKSVVKPIKKAKPTFDSTKIVEKIPHRCPDGTIAVTVLFFDKNKQLCDMHSDDFVPSVRTDILNMYRGQPYDLCIGELRTILK